MLIRRLDDQFTPYIFKVFHFQSLSTMSLAIMSSSATGNPETKPLMRVSCYYTHSDDGTVTGHGVRALARPVLHEYTEDLAFQLSLHVYQKLLFRELSITGVRDSPLAVAKAVYKWPNGFGRDNDIKFETFRYDLGKEGRLMWNSLTGGVMTAAGKAVSGLGAAGSSSQGNVPTTPTAKPPVHQTQRSITLSIAVNKSEAGEYWHTIEATFKPPIEEYTEDFDSWLAVSKGLMRVWMTIGPKLSRHLSISDPDNEDEYQSESMGVHSFVRQVVDHLKTRKEFKGEEDLNLRAEEGIPDDRIVLTVFQDSRTLGFQRKLIPTWADDRWDRQSKAWGEFNRWMEEVAARNQKWVRETAGRDGE